MKLHNEEDAAERKRLEKEKILLESKLRRGDRRSAQKRLDQYKKLRGERFLLTPGSPEELRVDEKIRTLIRPGIWEHWKSTPEAPKFYRVYRALPNKEHVTGDYAYLVEWISLYPPNWRRRTVQAANGPDGFLTMIEKPNYQGPRYIFRSEKLSQRLQKKIRKVYGRKKKESKAPH